MQVGMVVFILLKIKSPKNDFGDDVRKTQFLLKSVHIISSNLTVSGGYYNNFEF